MNDCWWCGDGSGRCRWCGFLDNLEFSHFCGLSVFNLTSFLYFNFIPGVSRHKIEEYLLGLFDIILELQSQSITMPLAANVAYNNVSPLYVWIAFMIYNWFQTNISIYALLNTLFSMDYRLLLIAMNFIGLYIFLRNARIDFTIRVRMNDVE
jgi:hypothetical protein